jgi:hypothetical protein
MGRNRSDWRGVLLIASRERMDKMDCPTLSLRQRFVEICLPIGGPVLAFLLMSMIAW